MSVINSDTQECWQYLANEASKVRPDPGKCVRIVKGRKHLGKEGMVMKNIQDRFEDVFRYGGEAHHHMVSMRRREGFVVLIKQDDGSTFWVKADYTEVLS